MFTYPQAARVDAPGAREEDRRVRRIAMIALAGSLLWPAAAGAAPTLDGIFAVSGTPGAIAPGPDGNVWFALSGSSAGKELGRIAPDGAVTEYDTPGNANVLSIAAAPGGKLWMSREGGVIEWDPVAGTGTSYSIATITGARGIAADPDGNVWVVRSDGLTEVDPTGTKVQDVEVAGSSGREIALGGDGRMWWADFGGSVRATGTGPAPATDTYAVGGGPQDIVAGLPGQLGFTNQGAIPHELGRIDHAGSATATPVPDTDPFGIDLGLDGAYWVAEFLSNTVGRMTSDGAHSSPISLPAGSGPRWIAAGPGGTLWVSLEQANAIARITGLEAPAPAPTPTPDPGGPPGGGPGQAQDTTAPVVSRLRVKPRRSSRSRRKRVVRFDLSEAARVTVRAERRRGGKWRRVKRVRQDAEAGRVKVVVKRRLRPGRHRVRVFARDAAGNRSAVERRGFRVRR